MSVRSLDSELDSSNVTVKDDSGAKSLSDRARSIFSPVFSPVLNLFKHNESEIPYAD